MGIAWSDSPSPISTARIWVPKQTKEKVILLGNWLGCWVHWMGKRTQPCLKTDCPKSRHARPVRWVGYAPIAIRTQNGLKPALLGLSPEKAKTLEPLLIDFPGPILEVTKRENSREWVIGAVIQKRWETEYPDCPDVQSILYRMWGIRPTDTEDGETQVEKEPKR